MSTFETTIEKIGGVDKTPFFLIQSKDLDENVTDFRSALDLLWPNSIIAYSVKTNSLPWILEWMNRHGVYAECVSDEEYELAQLAGFSEHNIVFNGPIKSRKKYLKHLKEIRISILILRAKWDCFLKSSAMTM